MKLKGKLVQRLFFTVFCYVTLTEFKLCMIVSVKNDTIYYIMIEGPIVYNFICNMYTTHNYLVTVRRIGSWEGRGRYSGTRQNP